MGGFLWVIWVGRWHRMLAERRQHKGREEGGGQEEAED